MASDKITKQFIVEVIGKGLKEVSNALRGINDSGKKVAKGTKRQTNLNRDHQKGLKGVAGATNNSTKAFSKMAEGMGGIVPLYANIAANVFALTAAFGALSRAADFAILQQSTEDYSKTTGIALGQAAKDVRELTLNMVTLEEAMRDVSIVTAAGFNIDTLKDLTKVARNAAIALGRDMGDSLDRVIRGAIKAEPELLDELGIILRLEPATRKYAAALGKAVSELTTFEKQQAVVNEIVEQGNQKFKDIGDSALANPYTQLAAAFDEVAKGGANLLSNVLGPIASFFSANISALAAVVGLFSVNILRKAIPALQEFKKGLDEKLKGSLKKSAAAFKQFSAGQESLVRAFKKTKDANSQLFSSVDKDLLKFTKNAQNIATSEGKKIGKGLTNAISLGVKDPKFYAKMLQVMRAGLTRLKAGNAAIGIIPTKKSISDLENLVSKTETANKKIRDGFKKTENVTLGVFSRIKLAGVGAAGALTGAFSGFLGVLSSSLFAGFGKGFEGGLRGIIQSLKVAARSNRKYENSLRDTNGQLGLFSGALAKTGATVSIFSTAVGAVGGALFKALPIIGQLTIAWAFLSTTLSALSSWFGIITKEQTALSDSAESALDTLQSVAESTAYYNENLSKLPDTLSNTSKQLDHQANRLREISSALTELNTKAANLDLTGVFVKLKDLFGAGALDAYKESLQEIANTLKDQGFDKEINTVLAKFPPIAELSGSEAKRLSKLLDGLSKSQLKEKDAAILANKAKIDTFKKLGLSIEGLVSRLPKLDSVSESIVRIASAIENIDTGNISELTQQLGEFKGKALISLGITQSDVTIAETLQNRLSILKAEFKDGMVSKEDIEAIPLIEEQLKILEGTFKSALGTAQTKLLTIKKTQREYNSAVAENNRIQKNAFATNTEKLASVKSVIEVQLKAYTAEQSFLQTQLSNFSKVAKLTEEQKVEKERARQAIDKDNKKFLSAEEKLLSLKDKLTDKFKLISFNLAKQVSIQQYINALAKDGSSQYTIQLAKFQEQAVTQEFIGDELKVQVNLYKQKLAYQTELTNTVLAKELETEQLKSELIRNNATELEIKISLAIRAADLAGLETDELKEQLALTKSLINERAKQVALGSAKSLIKTADISRVGGTSSKGGQLVALQQKFESDRLKIQTTRESLGTGIDVLGKQQELYTARLELEKRFQIDKQAIEREFATKAAANAASTLGTLSGILDAKIGRDLDKLNTRYQKEAELIEDSAKKGLISKGDAEKKLSALEKKRVKEAEATAKKNFENSKKLRRAEAGINIAAGVTTVLADTTLPWWGKAAAIASVLATGAAQLTAINTTSFNGGASLNTSLGGVTNPVQQQQEQQPTGAGNTTIRVLGRKGVVYSQDTMDELLDNIEEAVQRGDRILISRDSRNGIELAGDLA